MKPALTHLIFSCLLLQASTALLAQDTALEMASEQSSALSSKQANVLLPATGQDLEISTETTHMSPASSVSGALTLAVTTPEQAAMSVTPGICLVVDDIVRQYCTANPDDISCQFQ